MKNDWLHSNVLKAILPFKLRGRHVFHGEWNHKKTVCVSFDCDFKDDMMACDKLLPLLAEEKIRTSFALVGSLVKQHQEIVKNILCDHEVVNHTYSHTKSSALRFLEIWHFQLLMKDMFNYEPKGFRNPHGKRKFDPKFFEDLSKFGLYDSSYIGYGVAVENGVVEIPITPCPEHERVAFDTHHNFRLPLLQTSVKKFIKLWSTLLDTYNFVNIFLDPADINVSFENCKGDDMFRDMFQIAKDNGFVFRSLGEIAEMQGR